MSTRSNRLLSMRSRPFMVFRGGGEFYLFVIFCGPFRWPFNRYLPIKKSRRTALIRNVLSITRLSGGENKHNINRGVRITSTCNTQGPPIELVLIMFKLRNFLRIFNRTLAFNFTIKIMGGSINLNAFTTAIRVGRSNTTMFVLLTIFAVGNVSFITALLGTLCLIRQSKETRTNFAFAIQRVDLIASTIFNVLGSSACFNALLRRITNGTGNSIMNVFIFIRFIFTGTSSNTQVKATVSTSGVRTNANGTVKDSLSV